VIIGPSFLETKPGGEAINKECFMFGKIDDELRDNVIFFTKVKLIADAGADIPNSFFLS